MGPPKIITDLLRLAVGRAKSTESPFLQTAFFFSGADMDDLYISQKASLTSSMTRSLF